MIASREPLRLHRAVECHQVDKPAPAAQLRLWQDALGPPAEKVEAELGEIAQQFRLSAETIVAIAGTVATDDAETLGTQVWSACRVHSRPQLEVLAERIVSPGRSGTTCAAGRADAGAAATGGAIAQPDDGV